MTSISWKKRTMARMRRINNKFEILSKYINKTYDSLLIKMWGESLLGCFTSLSLRQVYLWNSSMPSFISFNIRSGAPYEKKLFLELNLSNISFYQTGFHMELSCPAKNEYQLRCFCLFSIKTTLLFSCKITKLKSVFILKTTFTTKCSSLTRFWPISFPIL